MMNAMQELNEMEAADIESCWVEIEYDYARLIAKGETVRSEEEGLTERD